MTAATAHAGEADRFQTEKVVTIAAAHGSHDVYFSFLPTILPELIRVLSLSKTEAGLLQVFSQLPALFQPLIGHLADRFSLRWLIILAPAVSATMVSLIGIAPNYGTAALLMLLAGFSTAAFHAVAPALVGVYSGKRLGRGMSFFMVGGELGFAIGPLVVVAAIGYLTLRGLPWLMAFGMLVSVILYLRIKEEPTLVHATGPSLPFTTILYNMRGVLLPLLGFSVATAFLNVSIGTFLPTLLNEEGSSLFVAGASFSLVELAATGGTLLSGWLSDRFGRRAMLVLTAVLTPLFSYAFLSVHGGLMVVALLAIGFSAYMSTPAIMAMVQETYSANRALANGAYLAINFVVRSLVTIIVGLLADRFGLRPIFWVNASICFLAVPFVFLLPKKLSR